MDLSIHYADLLFSVEGDLTEGIVDILYQLSTTYQLFTSVCDDAEWLMSLLVGLLAFFLAVQRLVREEVAIQPFRAARAAS